MFRPAYDWWPSPAACAHRRHPDIPAVDTGSSVMASRVPEGLIRPWLQLRVQLTAHLTQLPGRVC